MLDPWAPAADDAALAGARDFSLTLPNADPSFREWVRGILDQAAELSNPHPSAMGTQDAVATGPRRTLLADNGLVTPPWAPPFGLDAGPLQQLIIRDEFDRRGLAQPAMGIGQWVLSVAVIHGTAEQIDLVAAPTLRGEAIWCQLFSEPGAGSDVASLSLRGTKVEGGWTLTGQKVWTTHAHLADWGLCLARTDTESGRHGGLSMFIIEMHSPALDVRPIKQANGAAAALNLVGPAAALDETACEPVFHELDLPTWVIGGGTLEIQLNTIATFVMGLPRK